MVKVSLAEGTFLLRADVDTIRSARLLLVELDLKSNMLVFIGKKLVPGLPC